MKTSWAWVVFVACSACGQRESPVTVAVTARVLAPLLEARRAGATFDIHAATASVTEVTLQPCPGVAAQLWRWVNPLSTAHAHDGEHSVGTTNPAMALSLGHTATQPLVTLTPNAGRYCTAELVFGPSSEGPSLRVAGHRTDEAGGETPFEFQVTAVRIARLPISITLDEAHREGGLEVQFALPAALPDTIDLTAPVAGALLLDLVADSARAP